MREAAADPLVDQRRTERRRDILRGQFDSNVHLTVSAEPHLIAFAESNQVASAVENLKVETKAARINRPLPPQPKAGMYYPRLSVDHSSRISPESIRTIPLHGELQARLTKIAGAEARVQLNGRTAIIDAASVPAESLELISTLLSFEPGIDQVEVAPPTEANNGSEFEAIPAPDRMP